eukprot:186075_1
MSQQEQKSNLSNNIAEWKALDVAEWSQTIPNLNNNQHSQLYNAIVNANFCGETLTECESAHEIEEELHINKSLCNIIWNAYISLDNMNYGKKMVYCLLGKTGAGKSSFCNLISNSNKFKTSGSIYSCTQQLSKNTIHFMGDKRKKIDIIDIPGLNDASGKQKDNNTLSDVISTLYDLDNTHIMFLIILNSEYPRIDAGLQEMLFTFVKHFGVSFLLNTAVIYTRWYLDEDSISRRDKYDETYRTNERNEWFKQHFDMPSDLKIPCFFFDTQVFRYKTQNTTHKTIILQRMTELYQLSRSLNPFKKGNYCVTNDILSNCMPWIIKKYNLHQFNVTINSFNCSKIHTNYITLQWCSNNILRLQSAIEKINLINKHELYWKLYNKTENKLVENIDVKCNGSKTINYLIQNTAYTFEISLYLGTYCLSCITSSKQLVVKTAMTCPTCSGSGQQYVSRTKTTSETCGYCNGDSKINKSKKIACRRCHGSGQDMEKKKKSFTIL